MDDEFYIIDVTIRVVLVLLIGICLTFLLFGSWNVKASELEKNVAKQGQITWENRIKEACQKLTFLTGHTERAEECQADILEASKKNRVEVERQTRCVEENDKLNEIVKCFNDRK